METQGSLFDHATGIVTAVAGIAVLLGLIVWAVRKSVDPVRLVSRMVASLLVIPIFYVGHSASVPGFMVICALVAGGILAVLWTPYIAAAIAKPFGSLYDGGSAPPEPKPFYSTAEGKRRHGLYPEAVAAVQAELAKFPNDFSGQMMLAEIQAENLGDIRAAQETLQALLAQPGHDAKNIAFAMNRLADWHLKMDKDVEGAKQAIQNIVLLFPETEAAYQATQRLAHMDDPVSGEAGAKRFVVTEQTRNLGLEEGFEGFKPKAEDYEGQAAAMVKRLEAQPSDNEAREKLAILYGRHYKRMDLACEQIEQLLQQDGAPTSHRVRWLNLLADLHSTVAVDPSAARQALQRIIEAAPGSVEAEKATQRLLFIDRDLKNLKATPTFRIGNYEQNIGLKSPQYPSTDKSSE